MPTKWLPGSANLDHLKHQAKDLLRDFRAGHMAAYQRVREFHPKFTAVQDADMASHTFSLSDALLSIAREYGFPSWPRIKAVIAERNHVTLELTHNERLPDGPFKQALDFMDAGDVARLRQHLLAYPGLVREEARFEGGNYFSSPTLLEFLPENPNRQGRLPENALEIAHVLLEAGAKDDKVALNETVMLAASGQVCREHGVQAPLIRLLCAYGADPQAGMHSALAHCELEAVRVLLECGAPMDLEVAATLGDHDAVAGLAGTATEAQLQLALALAANAGVPEVIRTLLKAGADPNRYNPPGGHSHCTALHSAVASDQYETVVALVEAGADLEIKDIHHNMTPLGWARYLEKEKIVAFLEAQS